MNAWETMKLLLPEIGVRLGGISIERTSAIDLMSRVSSVHPDAVYYVDPPYSPDSRSSGSFYGEFEMSLRDHVVLLDFLLGLRARAVYVSSGPSALYERVLGGAGWGRDVRYSSNSMAMGVGKGVKESRLYFRC